MAGLSILQRIHADLWERPGDNFSALDGLRGFASVIVVFYHCAWFTGVFDSGRMKWLQPFINGLWSGMDIFFVLSGFLIGRLLMLDLEGYGRIHLRKFWIRRFCRIFPAYYLVLLVSAFVISRIELSSYSFLLVSMDRASLLTGAWPNYVYLNNYLHPGKGFFSWGWSLCIEEHFYLILPLLLWVIFRYTTRFQQAAILVLCPMLPLAGRAIQYLLNPHIILLNGFYFYTHNRIDEIFMGVLVAYFYVVRYDAFSRLARRCGSVLWIMGAMLMGSVWVFGGLQASGAFAIIWQFWVMAVGSSLLIVNGLFCRNVATRFFANQAWYPLARISYGTYLVHMFVLFVILQFWPQSKSILDINAGELVTIYVIVMGLSSLLTAIIFVGYESPCLRAGIRWARRYGPMGRAKTAADKSNLAGAGPSIPG